MFNVILWQTVYINFPVMQIDLCNYWDNFNYYLRSLCYGFTRKIIIKCSANLSKSAYNVTLVENFPEYAAIINKGGR
jgi:hypothetical protein